MAKMVDKIGQEIRPGQTAIWTAYNTLWMGTVKKVTAKQVEMRALSPHHSIREWKFRPMLNKILIVEDLPKAAVFWSMRG